MDLKPASYIFLQHDGGYYKLPFDASLGLIIPQGLGQGVLSYAGVTYTIPAADPAATTHGTPADRVDLAALITDLVKPIATAKPGDDLTALITASSAGFLDLEPGHYGAFDVP